jgi:hypothetical protein
VKSTYVRSSDGSSVSCNDGDFATGGSADSSYSYPISSNGVPTGWAKAYSGTYPIPGSVYVVCARG